jgi:hypothetical protein
MSGLRSCLYCTLCADRMCPYACLCAPVSLLDVIYGAGASADDSGSGAQADSSCIICYDGPKDTACLPCKHLCVICLSREVWTSLDNPYKLLTWLLKHPNSCACVDCAPALRLCPICRTVRPAMTASIQYASFSVRLVLPRSRFVLLELAADGSHAYSWLPATCRSQGYQLEHRKSRRSRAGVPMQSALHLLRPRLEWTASHFQFRIYSRRCNFRTEMQYGKSSPRETRGLLAAPLLS